MFSDTVSLEKHYNTQTVYDNYKKVHSELIAYIEVYAHDLPLAVMKQVAELFQTIAVYETRNTSEENEMMPKLLYEADLKITQSLYKTAICLFVKKIEQYKRIFRKYEYQGVVLEEYKYLNEYLQNVNFSEFVKEKEKQIACDISERLKTFYKKDTRETLKELTLKETVLYIVGYIGIYTMPTFGFMKYNPFVPINSMLLNDTQSNDLTNVFSQMRALLEMYEFAFESVLQNGAKKSLKSSVFFAVTSWIIPVILGIPVIIKIIEYIKAWMYG